MPSQPVPFRLCRDQAEVDLIVQALEEAGVAHKLSSTAANFDITALGAERDDQVAILVLPDQMAAATAAVAAAEEEAFEGVPDDHYLREYPDHELGQVLASDFEWSAYDVACARELLRERGALPTDAAIAEARDKYLSVLREGKQSNRALLILGILMAIFGGLPMAFVPFGAISAWMGWSFMTMKKTDPLGYSHYAYNENSRKEGRILFYFSIVSTVVWMGVFFFEFVSS